MPPPFVIPGKTTREWYKALILQLDDDDDEAEQKARNAIEKRAERDLRRAFREMQETLYPTGYLPDDPSEEIARLQRQFREQQSLQDAISRAIQDSADLGVSVAVEQLANIGYGFDYTLANLSARDWAMRHTNDLLRQLGTTTERIVGQSVGRWITNGEPLESLMRDLEPAFGRRRSELISATEVTRAYAEGTVAGYQASGVIKLLEWRTANDELVCSICGPLDGKIVGIEGSFFEKLPDEQRNALSRRVGSRFIRPPAHPDCRCWVVGAIEEVENISEAITPRTGVTTVSVEGDTTLLQRVNLTQDRIAQLFDIGPTARADVRITDLNDDGIEINGVWVDVNTDELIGRAIRNLFPDQKTAYLFELSFEQKYIGNGTGIKIARQWFDALGDAGYEEAEMYAGLTIGRYAWAKEGAIYADPEQAKRSTLLFREWIKEKGIRLSEDEYPTFTSVLDVATWNHPNGTTLTGKDIKNRDVPDNMILPLGKAFMLDMSFNGHGGWNGIVDLQARKSQVRKSKGVYKTTKRAKATFEPAYINGSNESQSDALFFDAYLVDDESSVSALFGFTND